MVDAQLPRRLTRWLQDHGHDALHTLDLATRNRTPDVTVMFAADQGDRVVVTKDNDFAESRVRTGRPKRLLHVQTGNISNLDLQGTVEALLPLVVKAFEAGAVAVRMTRRDVEIVG